MTSQSVKQTIAIQILPNISRSKYNLTMKFVSYQDITRDTFLLKNHTQNMTEELLLNLFLKIKTEYISGSVSSSFIQFAFIACQIDGY